MSNKTKDILDEVLDIEEPTTEALSRKNQTLLLLKEIIILKMLTLTINIRERTFII